MDVVTGRDFMQWQRGVGTTPPTALHEEGDADRDGDVDNDDLGIWKAQYGQSTQLLVSASSGASGDVVEATAALAEHTYWMAMG